MIHISFLRNARRAILGLLFLLFAASCTKESEPEARYLITVDAAQGTPIFYPPEKSFSKGQNVSVTLYPHPGYVFTGWEGDVVSTNETIYVTVNGNIELTASCAAASSAFVWPDTTNSGVPSGTVLALYDGVNTTTADNQVFDGLEITKRIYVNHANVTFRNCKLTGAADDPIVIYTTEPGSVTEQGGVGLTIEYCEVTGGIHIHDGFTAKHNYLHAPVGGTRDDGFIFTASNVLLESNLIEGLVGDAGAHLDGIQIMEGANIIVRNNWIDVRAPEITGGGVNAAIFFSTNANQNFGPINNVIVDHNMFIQDEGYYPLRIYNTGGTVVVQSNCWQYEHHGLGNPYHLKNVVVSTWLDNAYDTGDAVNLE